MSAGRPRGMPPIPWPGVAPEIEVRKNGGSTVGARERLNFVEGANVSLTVSDDAADGEVDITIAASTISVQSFAQTMILISLRV